MGVRDPRRQSCVANLGVHKSDWDSEILLSVSLAGEGEGRIVVLRSMSQ